ncbi:MAG: hypothetical protein AB7S38_12390 [Vulcanimicrobiota bacterium]
MSLHIVPKTFDPKAHTGVPAGQTYDGTRLAQRAAVRVEHKVDTTTLTLRELDNGELDLDPSPGVVKVDTRLNFQPIKAELRYDPGSGQANAMDAEWGGDHLRFRDNPRFRIYQWDDAGQHRKITEEKATGTLTVFQG